MRGRGQPPVRFFTGALGSARQQWKKLGENRIEKILNGCVIAENWQGNNDHVGHSYIMFDARRKLWHQTWVDNSGFLMMLEGDFQNGVMLTNSRAQYDL